MNNQAMAETTRAPPPIRSVFAPLIEDEETAAELAEPETEEETAWFTLETDLIGAALAEIAAAAKWPSLSGTTEFTRTF